MQKFSLDSIELLLDSNDLKSLKEKLSKIKKQLENSSQNSPTIKITLNSKSEDFSTEYILNEIEQITTTYTLERSKYYLKRLIKSIK
jgi:hypothetical protein